MEEDIFLTINRNLYRNKSTGSVSSVSSVSSPLIRCIWPTPVHHHRRRHQHHCNFSSSITNIIIIINIITIVTIFFTSKDSVIIIITIITDSNNTIIIIFIIVIVLMSLLLFSFLYVLGFCSIRGPYKAGHLYGQSLGQWRISSGRSLWPVWLRLPLAHGLSVFYIWNVL